MTGEVKNPREIQRLDRIGQSWAPGAKRHWMHIRAWVVSGRRIALPKEVPPAYHLAAGERRR